MLDSQKNLGANGNVLGTIALWPRKLKNRIASDAFLSGAGWLAIAQVIGRIFRLLTTLVVARLMTPEYFGLAAIALASNELAHVIARFGTSAYVVQANDAQLENTKHIANVLNWAIGLVLFTLQCVAAYPIALWYDAPEAFWLICVLALSYLIMPFGELHAALNQRNNNLDALAKGDIYQAIGDSVLTIIMAVSGMGVWALIIPKVLVVPLWIIPQRRRVSYTPKWPKDWALTGKIMSFSRQVLGVELLTIFRTNIDVFIVGTVLGVNALGVYFFAMNAGLGITKSLISALSRALYSYLCGNTDNRSIQQRFHRGLFLTLLIVVPWVALQSFTAQWYVPIIFGSQWVEHGAVPILIIFCLAGIPLLFSESASQFLRASNQTAKDLRWYLPFTVVYTLALFIGVNWGIKGAALAVLTLYIINVPTYYWFNLKATNTANDAELNHRSQTPVTN